MHNPRSPRPTAARNRIRLITALIAGSTLAAGTFGTISAASADSSAPTVPGRTPAAFGPQGSVTTAGASAFGETWKASDHPAPAGSSATAGGHAVSSMISSSTPIPAALVAAAKTNAAATGPRRLALANTSGLPSNYGISSSLESWINSGGVDALGAYSDLQTRYGKLPGQGEIITNVCVGDLTDASMAAAGDGYVKQFGPTTVVSGGQRYLDLPSMPLIPTYVADTAGHLNPLGSTENQDPTNGEIMLDFSVMAPLPHQNQRPENTGSGYTDLLGVAPGAKYRLVVPSSPTPDQIRVALLAAARQTPRPNVINASLGFGTDSQGFPGRYLEDDPSIQATITQIVHQYGITVSIAANDGTRLFTPTAVGPDGGSTPTDVAHSAHQATTIDDDSMSTTPSKVPDSGAIAAGGSTTDDTLAAGTAGPATVAETRITGSGDFSSGFGSRIDLSAPSDNIPAFSHAQGQSAQSVDVSLTGGTSASAPEIAAAAAVVDGAARLTGRTLTPQQIRDLLVDTGRKVATPGQIDRSLNVGPQVDVTAAVERLLPGSHRDDASAPGNGNTDVAGSSTTDAAGAIDAKHGATQIVRLGVQHHVLLGQEGGEFLESTDPGSIDLAGPADIHGQNTGEGLVGPLTFAADVVNAGQGAHYRLTVGSQHFDSDTPAIRITPTQLLTAAGLPVVSTTPRTVSVTFDVLSQGRTTATITQSLTLSATDGTYLEAHAPTAPATVAAGQDVTVHYDLTGVRTVKNPTLAVSTVGHWSPILAPLYNNAWTTPLTGTSGDVKIPASAFASGGGIYGITIIQDDSNTNYPIYGESAPIRVAGFTADRRPDAPTLTAGGRHGVADASQATDGSDAKAVFGHQAEVARKAPTFSLRYSVDSVPGAAGAMLEISSGAPTLWNSLNTFTAQNGTARDGDGFDSGSLVYQRLPGRSGTVTLDALKLGLATASQYNVRVVPVGWDGKAAGQASPSSTLTVDDGLPPAGGQVVDFTAKGADSVALVTDTSDAGESVRHYDPATGTYGSAITSDTTQAGPYAIIGVDDSAHRVVLMHVVSQDSYQLEVRNLADGSLVGTPQVVQNTPGLVIGGRVDATLHQAWVLQWAKSDYHDELLSVNVGTGAAGTPIEPDAAVKATRAYYNGIDVDASTGTVQLAHLADSAQCFGGAANAVINVSEATGAIALGTFTPKCGTSFASAQDGSKGTLLNYASFSVNFLSHTTLNEVDEKTLATTGGGTLRQQMAGPVALDSAHHVALIAYASPQPLSIFGHPGGVLTDSNSRSQIDVVDTDTGKVLKTLSSFEFTHGFGGPLTFTAEPDIQIDPATRTGFTYGPGWSQIEQFSY